MASIAPNTEPTPSINPAITPVEQANSQDVADKQKIAGTIANLNSMDEPTRTAKLATIGWTPDDFKPYLSDANKETSQEKLNETAPPSLDDFLPGAQGALDFAEQTIKENAPSLDPSEIGKHPVEQTMKWIGLGSAAVDPEGYAAGAAGSTALGNLADKVAPNHPYVGAALRLVGAVAGVVLTGKMNSSVVAPEDDSLLKNIKDVTVDQGKDQGKDVLAKEADKTTVPEIKNAAGILSPEALDAAKGGEKSIKDTYMQALNDKYPLHEGTLNKVLDQPAANSKDITALDLEQHSNVQEMARVAKDKITAEAAGDTDSVDALKQHFVSLLDSTAKSLAAHDTAMSGAGSALQTGRFQSALAKNAQTLLENSGDSSVDDLMKGFSSLNDVTDKAQSTAKMMDFVRNIPNGLHRSLIDAQFLNPEIPLTKAITDAVTLPYMAAMRSITTAITHRNIPAGIKMFQAATDGSFDALIEGWKYAKMTAKTDAPMYQEKLGLSDPHVFGDDFTDNTAVGGAGSYLKNAANIAFGAGRRSVMALGEWANVVGRRLNMNTQGYYRALQDAEKQGLSGARAAAYATVQGKKYVAMADSGHPAGAWLRKLADSNMAQDTFTDDDWATKTANDAVNLLPFPLKIVAPYTRTPIDLLEQGIINSPLAPLAPKFIEHQLGASGDELTALTDRTRMALGTALFGQAVRMGMSGRITGDGPTDPKTLADIKEMGFNTRVVRLGNKEISYRHLPVIAQVLAMGANYAQYSGEMSDESASSYAKLGAKMVSNLVVHAPFLDSMLHFSDMVNTGLKGGGQAVAKYAGQLTDQFIPEPLAEIAKLQSPEIKEIIDPNSASNTFLNQIMSKMPGMSKYVKPYRDWKGNIQYIPPGIKGSDVPPHWWHSLLNDMNPFPVSYPPHLDNIDKELIRNTVSLSRIPKTYSGSATLEDDPTNPKAYPAIPADLHERMEILAGHELKIAGLNQHDFMENTINGDFYKSLDSMFPNDPRIAQQHKADYLQSIHSMFKKTAMNQVLFGEHPEQGQKIIQQKMRQVPQVQ